MIYTLYKRLIGIHTMMVNNRNWTAALAENAVVPNNHRAITRKHHTEHMPVSRWKNAVIHAIMGQFAIWGSRWRCSQTNELQHYLLQSAFWIVSKADINNYLNITKIIYHFKISTDITRFIFMTSQISKFLILYSYIVTFYFWTIKCRKRLYRFKFFFTQFF